MADYDSLFDAPDGGGRTEYDSLFDKPKQRYSGSLLRARDADPDAVARARMAERDLGVPAALAERNPDRVERRRQQNEYDRLFTVAPKAADWLAQGDNARIAHDDTANLSAFEQSWQTVANIGRGIGERGADLAGGLTRFIGSTADPIADQLERVAPLGMIQLNTSGDGPLIEWRPSTEADIVAPSPLRDMATALESVSFGYEPMTTWEDVKNRPLSQFIPFALEQGLVSVPDMAAVLVNLPGYVAARTGEIGQERAGNDGRANATIGDFVKAAPAAVSSALLERFGARGILGLDDALKGTGTRAVVAAAGRGAVKEGLTEFSQEAIESAGGTVGTEAGFDLSATLDQALAGLVAGSGFGGGLRAVTATAENLAGRRAKARSAQDAAAALDQAGAAAAASKLLQRDRETAREFFQSVAGEDGKLYVPLDQLDELFDGDRQAVASLLRSWRVQDQEAEARATGGDLVVKVGDFFTVADAEYFGDLTKRVRTAPGEWTLVDAERAEAETPEQLSALVDQLAERGAIMAEDAETRTQAYGRILDEARRRLQATGQGLEASGPQAELLARGLFTMAERLGRDPLDYAREAMPEIVADVSDRVPAVDDLDAVIDRARSGRRVRDEVKTPVLNVLRERGGVRIGSPLAGELEAMGVTPRTRPGLFLREQGLSDVDNIVASEVDLFADAPTDENGYVDRNHVLEAIRDEIAGAPHLSQDQADRARRLDDPADQLGEILRHAGVNLADVSNDDVKAMLRQLEQAGADTPLRHHGPVIEIAGATLGDVGADPAKARQAADAWFRETLQGTEAQTRIGAVRFSARGRKKMRSTLFDPETARYVPAIRTILEEGDYEGSVPNREPKRKPNVARYHRFSALVSLDGAPPHKVAVLVEEDHVGHLFYNLYREAPEVDPGVSSPGTAGAKENGTSYEQSITLTDGGINLEIGQGARGSYSPAGNIIRLTEARNLSTFLHESGHFYTFLLGREAGKEGAPQSLVDDWRAVRDWWAGNAADIRAEAVRYARQAEDEDGAAALEAMADEDVAEIARTGNVLGDSGPLSRAMHEQFARGFEAYLRDGRAPSAALRDAFARFKAWLTRLYRDITRLDVTLTDDVRAVFDRLLATDAEIEQVRRELNYIKDLDAEALGLTEAEAEEATRLMDRAAAEAREEVDTKILRQVARENERWWREERAKVRTQVEGDVRRRAVYRAFLALAFGKTPEGGETPLRFKLSRDALVDAYGEDALKLLPRPYVYSRSDGIHQDVAAPMFGFANGDDLVKALWNMERMRDVIDRETDALMVERHGDMMRDGTLEREALEAAHNDAQARFLAVEYQAIQRRGGEGAPVKVLRDAAKRIIRDRKTGDAIQPERYRQAEIKAAQAAERALADRDYQAAVHAKAQQILNHHLYREASKARDEVDGIIRYFGQFLNPRRKWGGVDRQYLDSIRSVLEAYNFGPRLSDRRRLREELRALNDWLERQQQDPDAMLVIPEVILKDDQTEHYRDMPLGHLYALRDMVKSLHRQGRLKKKLTLEKEEREWSDYVEEVAGSIEAAVEPKDKFVETADGLRAQNPRFWERQAEAVRSADAALLKIEQLAVWLDGGERGTFWKAVFKPMADAQAHKYDLLKEFGGRVQAEFDRMSPELRRWLHREQSYPVVNRKMCGAEVMALALNWGNEGNRDRVLLGYNWNPGQVEYVLRDMPQEAWGHVQAIWDIIDGLYPHINAVHKRETDVDLPKVEPTPVVLQGREVARGGYYPIMYDSRRSHQALQHEQERDAASLFENNYIRPDTERGFTKTREDRVKRPVLLSLDALPRHLVNVTHYVAHYEAVKRVDRLLSSSRVQRTITERFGPEYYRLFRPWLQAIGRDTADDGPAHLLDRVLGRLRLGMSVYAMGLKVSTALAQPAGLFTSVDDLGRKPDGSFSSAYGLKWLLSGFRSVFGNGGARGIQEAFKKADELSGELRHRMQTQDRELRQVLGKVVRGPGGGVVPALQQAAFWHIAWIDKTVSVVTWYGAYNKAVAENGGNPQEAVAVADSVVRLTQSSGAIKDMATVQRGGETRRIFTMFYTYFSALYARLRDTGRASVAARDVAQAVARWMWLASLPVLYDGMVAAVTRGGVPWKDDEEGGAAAFAEWFAMQNILYPMTSVPFARDIASGVLDQYGYSLSPVDTFGETVSRAGRSLFDGVLDRDDIEETIKAIGIGAALPVGQAWKTGEYLYDLADGNTEPDNPFAVLQGLVGGTPREDKE